MGKAKSGAQNLYGFARSIAIDNQKYVQNQAGTSEPNVILPEVLLHLNEEVSRERLALDQIRTQSQDPFEASSAQDVDHLWRLRCIKAAYEQLVAEPPDLPSQGSSLPNLLALRAVSQSVVETRIIIPNISLELSLARDQVVSECARLHAMELLATVLRRRISRDQDAIDKRAQSTPEGFLEAKILDQTIQQNQYVDEGDRLLKQTTAFINDHLASMLAAEDKGGPAIGDDLDIADAVLGAGFTASGRSKSTQAINQKQDTACVEQGAGHRAAASKDFRQNIRRLLKSYDYNPEAYVTLERETASTRFLVQAKLAQLDPTDAHRARLVDFLADGKVVT